MIGWSRKATEDSERRKKFYKYYNSLDEVEKLEYKIKDAKESEDIWLFYFMFIICLLVFSFPVIFDTSIIFPIMINFTVGILIVWANREWPYKG